MANVENTLIIRHIPAELSPDDKDDLLRHFGALKTRIMGTKGPMKHTAFATFKSEASARSALSRLHQLEILDCRLTAEFCRAQHQPDLPDDKISDGGKDKNVEARDDKASEKLSHKANKIDISKSEMTEDECYKAWGFKYPRNINLCYFYPPPSVSVLTNITNALAACPKFYVQVLHLMNKLNLPSPFGPVTPSPPMMVSDSYIPRGPDNVEMEEMEFSSTEESEIETDDDDRKVHVRQDSDGHVHSHIKRRRKRARKKPKLSEIQNVPVDADHNASGSVSVLHIDVKDIFEKAEQTVPKKIQLNLPSSLSESKNPVSSQFPSDLSQDTHSRSETHQYSEESGGFGKLEPVEAAPVSDSDEQPEEFGLKFISGKELRRGKISRHQMKEFPAFKNYDAGECTSRLYVKNLAKQTTEKDLHYLFGRYINWGSEMDRNMFDIRLMKEGRMKGQAFITFPSDKLAQEALNDVNGFVLNSKPIVVQFGRSAKAKLPEESVKP